ncbi:hypothetical protein BCR44DRAFT_1255416 [Catenaria anguillulae PL171]|uniref:dolichol kinase n=1 Tax=Catenaria anguillulae PL171 TaxID=765915 RepID=A0A1Y2HC08_9FUNG|nr:hypothetical protein BCR44DRAFT_1255416 [Catenaria anguillulae PL171]
MAWSMLGPAHHPARLPDSVVPAAPSVACISTRAHCSLGHAQQSLDRDCTCTHGGSHAAVRVSARICTWRGAGRFNSAGARGRLASGAPACRARGGGCHAAFGAGYGYGGRSGGALGQAVDEFEQRQRETRADGEREEEDHRWTVLGVGRRRGRVDYALMYVRSGYEPWTWVIGYIASSRAHVLMTAYWLFVLFLGFTFFPWRRSANTQRKTYHLLAIAILLPGYLWTPVFLSLALTVALSAFVFAELLRLAQAPPLGPLLESALGTFRDHRDEALVLTSHVYLLLGLALPVWVGVIEGTWRAGLAGMAALGVGDAVASLVGRRFGTWRWFAGCDKSVQGSAGFVAGTLAFFVAVGEPLTLPLVGAVVATAGVEAVSSQFDNFVVPLVMLLTIM